MNGDATQPVPTHAALPSKGGGALPSIPGYALAREIARGGQGVVYEGVQISTGQRVAVKVVRGGPFIGAAARERFEREVRVLATLQHPGIVSVIDRGATADGSVCLVMPFVEGDSLEEHIAGRCEGTWELRDVLRVFVQIAEAVEEAHQHQVVHRDLKPTNILVDARGEPHVLDFGVARVLQEDGAHRAATLTGEVLGSLAYASPEQASGSKQVDARSDVYSIGVMLYRALAGGKFPYDVGGTTEELLRSIASAAPAPLKGAADAKLESIVHKALEKTPRRRYATAGLLAEDLREYLEGNPVGTRRRRVWWPWAAGVMLVLLAAVWPLYRHFTRDARPTITNSIGMKLALIPAGEFMIGSPETERDHYDLEPHYLHRIEKPFYIGISEVTRRQYRAVMNTDPSSGDFKGDDLPVTRVTWEAAAEFCKRLSQREGRTYRLPTEAEWEYACRAGTAGPIAGTGNLDEMGWYERNSKRVLHPVMRLKPNHWGLYDMHGNVSEWTADWYHADPRKPRQVPPGGVQFKVRRGGDLRDAWGHCRSAARATGPSTFPFEFGGFRVVLEP